MKKTNPFPSNLESVSANQNETKTKPFRIELIPHDARWIIRPKNTLKNHHRTTKCPDTTPIVFPPKKRKDQPKMRRQAHDRGPESERSTHLRSKTPVLDARSCRVPPGEDKRRAAATGELAQLGVREASDWDR